jgi:hypothetical protein
MLPISSSHLQAHAHHCGRRPCLGTAGYLAPPAAAAWSVAADIQTMLEETQVKFEERYSVFHFHTIFSHEFTESI